MPNFFTPEELAQTLKIEVSDLMALIDGGKLPAIRIGDNIRISEREVEKMHETFAAVPTAKRFSQGKQEDGMNELPDGSRWCATRTGRAKFRVSGSIESGAQIWPGQMRYPIKFPKSFMDKVLARFSTGEFPVGGKFDDPGPGSLGEFIQTQLEIKMNPAVYLAALLIDEGYAEPTRRGHIRLIPSRSE